jgi:hypothetical protein
LRRPERAYPPAVSSEHLPARAATKVVEVVGPTRSVTELVRDVEAVRSIATTPPSRQARRFVFMWLRVFVHGQKRGKHERVNVRVPIPIPVLGGFFPRALSRQRALRALAIAQSAENPAQAVSDYLDSVMGFEFVRRGFEGTGPPVFGGRRPRLTAPRRSSFSG